MHVLDERKMYDLLTWTSKTHSSLHSFQFDVGSEVRDKQLQMCKKHVPCSPQIRSDLRCLSYFIVSFLSIATYQAMKQSISFRFGIIPFSHS